MVKITQKLEIPDEEIRFTFSRSSGPGGQNVNKVNTKATLRFDIDSTKSLTPEQKKVLKRRLHNRISRNGVLTVSSDRFRSQRANREEALRRFVELLNQALKPRPKRKKTSIPRAARERRLREKKHRSRIKAARRKDLSSEW